MGDTEGANLQLLFLFINLQELTFSTFLLIIFHCGIHPRDSKILDSLDAEAKTHAARVTREVAVEVDTPVRTDVTEITRTARARGP